MPRISTDNYDTVASWNGSQDLFVVEQPDGTKVATPEQVKQYVLNDMDEVPTQGSDNPVKSGGIFSTMAVPKYDATNRREYFEGGAAFDGNIDSSPTAGSNNAVASGGVKTYVDNAIQYFDIGLNANSIGHEAPRGSGGGVYYEPLVTFAALNVTKDKVLNIIPVGWNYIAKPFTLYMSGDGSHIGVMTDSATSIYVNIGNLTLRVVYKNY